MELDFLTDRDDAFESPSMLVKNVSERAYVDVYNSVVYAFKPGETKSIEEQKGLPVDDWGLPKVPPNYDARDKDGRRLHKEVALVTRQAGALDDIWKALNGKAGNPLVRLRSDGKDGAREKWKLESYCVHALKTARYIVDQWLKRCRDNITNGNPVEDKPVYVFDAEQDIRMLSRNTTEKRYKVKLDGSRWNTMEECERHIRSTPWLSSNSHNWQQHVEDMKGDDMLAPAAPIESTAPGVTETGASRQPSAAVAGVLKLAANAGKTLSSELVSRLDSDPDAMMEAMDFIMADEDEDGAGEPLTRRPGESNRAFKARVAAANEGKPTA